MSGGTNKSRMRKGGPKKRSRVSTYSLISEREGKQTEVDQALTVLRSFYRQYGDESVVTDAHIAKMSEANANVIAYYDGGSNVAVNERYFDTAKMDDAYDACYEAGFHPTRGNKPGIEAVVAHEMGHKMTDAVAQKLGYTSFLGIDPVAERIVREAAQASGVRGSGFMTWAARISGYAAQDAAEAVAEACSDVYCNGLRAKRESRAIMNVLNRYMRGRTA